MPDPLPLPVRVLIKGPSNVGIIAPMSGPRSDFTYPRVVEAELLANGRPAEVRAHTVPGELVRRAMTRWEQEVIGFSPDVVVLAYGHYEAVHYFLPWWLERHANSWRSRPKPVREQYRKRLLRPVWMSLAKLQAKLDTRFGPLGGKLPPKRVVADLEQLVTRVRTVQSPLVLLVEVQPPTTARFRSWFPGMAERIRMTNEAVAAMVERMGEPDVRWVTTTELVDEHAGDDRVVALPDGWHYSPTLHRAVGEKLARVIMDWAETQEHLKPGR